MKFNCLLYIYIHIKLLNNMIFIFENSKERIHSYFELTNIRNVRYSWKIILTASTMQLQISNMISMIIWGYKFDNKKYFYHPIIKIALKDIMRSLEIDEKKMLFMNI